MDGTHLELNIHPSMTRLLDRDGWDPPVPAVKLPSGLGKVGKRAVRGHVIRKVRAGMPLEAEELVRVLSRTDGAQWLARADEKDQASLADAISDLAASAQWPSTARGITLVHRRKHLWISEKLESFSIKLGDREAFILPHQVAGFVCQSWDRHHQVGDLSEVFDSVEEADTTLRLWTPGSGDEWANFEYAHKTAMAL